MLLFTTTMTVVGIGLGVYFIAFARVFASGSASIWMKRFAWAPAAFGVLVGVCFVGVGATPHHLVTAVHNTFAAWAFRFLLAAAVLELPALRLSCDIPVAALWVNVALIGVLAGYLLLGILGPPHGTFVGEEIQVGGQQIIACTAITAVVARSLLIRSYSVAWHRCRVMATPADGVRGWSWGILQELPLGMARQQGCKCASRGQCPRGPASEGDIPSCQEQEPVKWLLGVSRRTGRCRAPVDTVGSTQECLTDHQRHPTDLPSTSG